MVIRRKKKKLDRNRNKLFAANVNHEKLQTSEIILIEGVKQGDKMVPCILLSVKNDPTRFLGEGVSFKAKLIGILEVSEARGDRMCQAALADLKMAIRAAGEHKQRIAVQVSIDGLRLRDEKTGVSEIIHFRYY